MKFNELYNYEDLIVKDFFNRYTYPYECLGKIKDFIINLGKTLD